MHIELHQLIAYRDGAIEDASEREMIEQKLAECEECRARYDALDHLAVSFKGYFVAHRPERSPDCPDEGLWMRYLSDGLDASEQARWKAHLQQCDYCFGIAASLEKEQMDEAITEPLRAPEWLRQRTRRTSEVPHRRPFPQGSWEGFAAGLREVWKHLVAQPRWAYAVAGFVIVLFAGWLVRQQMHSTDSPDLAELPGESVQLAGNSYQLLVTWERGQPESFPESPGEWERWYNALTGENQPRAVVALLTPSLVEALNALTDSQQDDGLERLTAELEAQMITLPEQPVGGVLVERTLIGQLLQGTHTPNQHVLLTFLSSNVPSAQIVLKIEADG